MPQGLTGSCPSTGVACLQPLGPAAAGSAIDVHAAAFETAGHGGAAGAAAGSLPADAAAVPNAGAAGVRAAAVLVAAASSKGSEAVASRKRRRDAEEGIGKEETALLDGHARQQRQQQRQAAAPPGFSLLSPQPGRHRMLAPLLPPPPLLLSPSLVERMAVGDTGPVHAIASPLGGPHSLLSPPPLLRTSLASPLGPLGSPPGALGSSLGALSPFCKGGGGGPAGNPAGASWNDLARSPTPLRCILSCPPARLHFRFKTSVLHSIGTALTGAAGKQEAGRCLIGRSNAETPTRLLPFQAPFPNPLLLRPPMQEYLYNQLQSRELAPYQDYDGAGAATTTGAAGSSAGAAAASLLLAAPAKPARGTALPSTRPAAKAFQAGRAAVGTSASTAIYDCRHVAVER